MRRRSGARLAGCLDVDGQVEQARAEREVARQLIAGYDDSGIAALRRELIEQLGE